MRRIMEVPRAVDLIGLPLEVIATSEPGVVSLIGKSPDGSAVTLTWDEAAGSVHLRWTCFDTDLLIVERECVSKISVRQEKDDVQYWIWLDVDGVGGQLVVTLGDVVTVSDSLLRK
jgi:hypothetical protein